MWTSVKDDLPKRSGAILVRAGDRVYQDTFKYDLERGFKGYDNITHWQDMPEARKDVNKGKIIFPVGNLEVTEPLNGIELIKAERERQIYKEGFTPEHDAKHLNFELSIAAACYAIYDNCQKIEVMQDHGTIIPAYRDAWPWGFKFDKREKHDRIARLTIAGALIAAEIDRLSFD